MDRSAQLQRLMARMEAAKRAPREAIRPALIQSGEELAAAMRALAETSRDTGDLIDSIEVTAPGQTTPAYSQPGGARTAGEAEVLVTAGNSDVRYPHLVEYGTSDTEAQPFFWPAYRMLKPRLQGRIKRAVAKAIRDEMAK